MQTFSLIALSIIAVGLALSWLARRWFSPKVGTELSLLPGFVARLTAVVILFWTSVRIAEHGGVFIALAVPLGLLALALAALSAIPVIVLWQSLTGRLPTPTTS